ncbi:MAG: hypothetical protein AAF918_03180 [Pseudomonadota bacterium]
MNEPKDLERIDLSIDQGNYQDLDQGGADLGPQDEQTRLTSDPAANAIAAATGEPVVTEAVDPSIAAFAYTLAEPEGALLGAERIARLGAWREILVAQGLMNLTSSYEMAHAFGCLSTRDPDSARAFVMTQPGGEAVLGSDRLLRVTGYTLERSWIEAMGSEPPRVDALVHAAIYATDSRIQWVFQCRSAAIDDALEHLNLPAVPVLDPTHPRPVWLRAHELLHTNQTRPLVFRTPETQGSVFACAATARDAGVLLLAFQARALEVRYRSHLPAT